ncbi:MAG: hypothetical protein ACYCSP_10240 [Acidobacteriaceae bacterium]
MMKLSQWCGIAVSLAMAGSCAAQCGSGVKGVEVQQVDAENNQITLVCPGLGQSPTPYKVDDAMLQARLSHLHPGDQLTVWTSGTTLKALVLTQAHIDTSQRWYTLVGVAAAWVVVGLLLSKFRVLQLIMGEDGRYSNSKFQAVVWFSLLIVFYAANVILREHRLGVGLMGVSIPQNLLLLSGLSAFSFAAAKGITTAKVQNAFAQGIAAPKGGAGSKGLIVDLTTNDSNQIDLGDFQMLVITLIASAYYLVLAFTTLGTLDASANSMLPDVDTTILAAFGLGQGAYLAKKAVGEVGKT